VTPGAALAIGWSGGEVLRSYGRLDYAPGSPPVTDSTLYDLASLTKVVATATAVMLLVDRGRMDLDAPLSHYLPAWPPGGWRDSVTVRRLLRHQAGLAPFERFWHPSAGALRGPASVIAAIAAMGRRYAPGRRTEYSDLAFILLGAAVEAVTGESLDMFLDREAWTPLGMRETGFLPRPELIAAVRAAAGLETGGDTLAPLERIAPTERDTVFRQAHVRGVVHDENAFAMGGVAGHAGLFSTARDMARFARMLLEQERVDGERLVEPATLSAFTRRGPGADRGLGWDLAPGASRIAAALSRDAFGHTGFTGTSLWVDPVRGVSVVLLTNRVNPSREGTGVTALRRRLHELVARGVANENRDPRS
jgi:CubicO group peptidase (beta-lactamase class C family)